MASLKLDENMPDSVAGILRSHGHDVALAREQSLAGVEDDRLLREATAEGRAVVTFDLHFADIRRHAPSETAGVVVLRLGDQTLEPVRRAATALATLLLAEPVSRRLWVIDEHRVRIWPRAVLPEMHEGD